MNQKEFANHVGVKPYVIAELEVSRYPRAAPRRLVRLAAFLNVDVAQLNPNATEVARGQRGGRWPRPEQPSQHQEEVDEEIALYDRPTTRSDCLTSQQRYHNLHVFLGSRGIEIGPPDEDGGDGEPDGLNCARPCPYVSCKHHLFLDVNERSRGLKVNFPSLDVWQLSSMSVAQLNELDDETLALMEEEEPGSTFPSCSLDVADVGGVTLDRVGNILNVTRERARQLEVSGKKKYKAGLLAEYADEHEASSPEDAEVIASIASEVKALVEDQAADSSSDYFFRHDSTFSSGVTHVED